MTTDEQILALRDKHGFVLPEGVYHDIVDGSVWWYFMGAQPCDRAMIHDLCAMSFARQVASRRIREGRPESEAYWPFSNGGREIRAGAYKGLMGFGNSAAAIDALYNALEAK